MKNKLLIMMTIVCVICCAIPAYTQTIGIDSKGESVFTNYILDNLRFDINRKTPVSVTYSFGKFKTDWAINDSCPTVSTDLKWFANFSVKNSNSYLGVNDVLKNPPGFGLKVGIQKGISNFANICAWDNGAYSGGINGFANLDNIKLLNPAGDNIQRKLPTTFGVEIVGVHYFNWFIPKNTSNLECKKCDCKGKNKVLMVAAGHITLSRTWNDDALINYQSLQNTTIIGQYVALKNFEGRYGVLNNNIYKCRAAVSLPLYYWHLNPIPYAVVVSQSHAVPKYEVGLYVNYVHTLIPCLNYQLPKASVGIGMSSIYSGTSKWSSPAVFIGGSFSI